jgi:anthranilate synthase component 1
MLITPTILIPASRSVRSICATAFATVQAGAGIVADSVPDREFEECVNKARAMFRAVELAEKGL